MAKLQFKWAIATLRGRRVGPPPWSPEPIPPGWGAWRASRFWQGDGETWRLPAEPATEEPLTPPPFSGDNT
jgi:hypothetical protein